MDRRAFLRTAGGAAAVAAGSGLPAPALSQSASRTVRLVPHADLANFDPIWSSAYIARNAGLLVWDTLYGVDAKLKPQRQMVEAEEVSADGLVWTFRLRQGLKFHDGEKVTAQDAVASLNRWAVREPMGAAIKASENELVALDDRSFRWSLKKPYPKMLLALGKVGSPCCFIMPTRIAATDPYKQIGEYIGSGPMRFVKSEWVPGSRAVFEKFADYVPRDEPASWLSGGKRIVADRVEWVVMPDPATASAALQNGEVDWVEVLIPDIVPVLQKNPNVKTGFSDPLGFIGVVALNHLFAPFKDARARRAILTAMSQEDYMHAFVGENDSVWKPLPGYFPPGTPLYNEEGGDILKGPRKLDAAKRMLAESGYAGEPVICMASQDLPHHKAWGDVTVDLLKRLGINVDFAALDWGTIVARRAQKSPPGQGGWHVYHTNLAGADCVDPTNKFIRADGGLSLNGWAKSADVEAGVSAWFEAGTLEAEQAAARSLNKAALEDVVYAPLGWYLRYHGWRKNLAGVGQGPLPFFWGVGKARIAKRVAVGGSPGMT